MYYRSGSDVRCCIWRARTQTLRVNYSPGGGTFLREITSWNFDVKSITWLRQSMQRKFLHVTKEFSLHRLTSSCYCVQELKC